MNRRNILMLVALTAVVATVAALWRPLFSDQPMTLTAQFDDAAGLYVGNAVAILGMPVGKVTSITPKADYVEVVFTVDKGIDVPADVQAVTVSTSILTDRHIELTPPYRDGPALHSGDLIGLGRTKTPVQFDRVLKMVDRLSAALKGDGQGDGAISRLIDIGSRATADGNGTAVKDALDQLSHALRLSADGGNQSRDNITQIVAALSALTESATENDTKIRRFGSAVRQLSEILADENLGSGTTGKQVNQLLTQAADFLDKNHDNLNRVLRQSTTTTGTLVDKQRDISEIVDVLPLLTGNIYNAIDPANGALRGHLLVDKLLFDSQLTKEVCNLMGLRQLGCSTGTLQDYGPDFGLTSMLDGMARMGQK